MTNLQQLWYEAEPIYILRSLLSVDLLMNRERLYPELGRMLHIRLPNTFYGATLAGSRRTDWTDLSSHYPM